MWPAPGSGSIIMIRIIVTLLGIGLIIAGGRWILIGANIWVGSAMSGQSQWLLIGIAAGLAGLALLYWMRGRRTT